MSTNVLVTGGAGYIGSHMVRLLLDRGYRVTVIDDLSTGHADAVGRATLVRADIRDQHAVDAILRADRYGTVMHFAARCYVGESMHDPEGYFSTNIEGTLRLLAAMRANGTTKLVFSSTCSTFGEPVRPVIDESHPQAPVNPYGVSKLACEQIMREYARAYSFDIVALRYFNAAGCHPSGELGERHQPETHLIPLVLREALRLRGGGLPQATSLQIFGDDFDTPDGTCIRDFVHVDDLCNAHELALHRLLSRSTGGFEGFNLGTGVGHSVKEIVDVCRRITGTDIRYRISPRRPGDPGRLVASSALAASTLGWRQTQSIDEIAGSAWRWFSEKALT